MRTYTLTVDQVVALNPCHRYSGRRLKALWAGREALTAGDIVALDIPQTDRLWALLRMAPPAVWMPAIYRAVDRAVRVHAAAAFERAGSSEQAARLRALMPITDEASASAVYEVARADCDEASARAADCTARAVGYAARLSYYDAASAAYYMVRAGDYMARAAEYDLIIRDVAACVEEQE